MLDEEGKVAVALLYDKISAPRVLAKGRDDLASSILEIAKEAEVPITEDYILAEILDYFFLLSQFAFFCLDSKKYYSFFY